MELLTIKTQELQNRDLKNALNKINKAIYAGVKNQWIICSELRDIVNSNMFAEDFATLENFAAHLKMSTGNLSKLTRVLDYRDFIIQQFKDNSEYDEANALEKKGTSFFMELLPIKPEDLSVAIWDMELNADLTVTQVRGRVKAYLNSLGTYAPQSITENKNSVPEVPDNVPEVPDNVPEVPDNVPEVPDNVPEVPKMKRKKVTPIELDTMVDTALRNSEEGLLYLANGMTLKIKFFVDKDNKIGWYKESMLDMVNNKEYACK